MEGTTNTSSLGKTDKCRVLLVDDHGIVRHAVRAILEASQKYIIIGEAGDADEGIRMSEELKPDIIVLDLSLPGKSGLEALYELRQKHSEAKILVLTMHEDEPKVKQALQAGANGYLLKNTPSQEFIDGLAKVREGEVVLSRKFEHLRQEVESLRNSNGNGDSSLMDPLSGLSKREREVFYLLADGMPNRVIAKKLFISPRTVETHRARVIRKLGFQTTADLIRFAIRNNLLSL